MSLAGYLSEYSLAEIFHFVQEGNKTGLLSIEPNYRSNLVQSLAAGELLDGAYYISFQSGRVVSVSQRLDRRDLLKMMEQRRWLSPEQIAKLETQLNAMRQPLGTYLKSCNAVNAEQLKLLFNSQVIANISKLFKIHQGRFTFDPKASLNYAEMTGLSLTAQEGALLGLRVLKDWSGLTAKLPDPQAALQRLSSEPAGLRLETHEWQLWQLALGEKSIVNIAAQLSLEVEKVQQIGFRLMSIGLMQEIAAEPVQPPLGSIVDVPKPICVGGGNAPAPVSASFLGNLMGFLKKKG